MGCDFFMTFAVVASLIWYGRMFTYISILVFIVIGIVLWRWLSKSGDEVKRKALRWVREKFPLMLPLFPLFSLLGELNLGLMPVGAYVHFYAALACFFSQLWIVQRQVGLGF
jgi:hypothetical protein